MPIGIGLAIAGIAGAGASIFGASQQVSAEQQAIQAQKQMFQQGLTTQKAYLGQASGALNPFIQTGQGAEDWYSYLTGTGGVPTGAPSSMPTAYNPQTAPLTAPFTAANLASTPGYQFTLGQGLRSTESQFASEGLGTSGAAAKGAAQFATGLAGETYNSQFQNYLAQNQQIANLLMAPTGIGANAAGGLAGLYGSAGNTALGGAVSTGQGVGSSLAGIGNAYAGGAAGVAGSLGNNLLMYSLMQKYGTPAAPGAPGAAATPVWGGGAFGGSTPAGYGPQIDPFNAYGTPYGTAPGTLG